MNSPFTDTLVPETGIVNTNEQLDEILNNSPLLQPEQSHSNHEEEFINPDPELDETEDFILETEEENGEFNHTENFDFSSVLQSGAQSATTGSFGEIRGYEDPNNAGVPLLKVGTGHTMLSKNFSVHEFARAQKGLYKWKYYRADKNLVSQLQTLRDKLGKSITIIDGYFPPKYYREILKKPAPPAALPHFSGRGLKIKIAGMTGKQIAEAIITNCDPDIRIAADEESASMYISSSLPRIASTLRDPLKNTGMLIELRDLDERLRYNKVYIKDWDIPKPVFFLSAPRNDYRLTAGLAGLKKELDDLKGLVSSFEKLFALKSDTLADMIKKAKPENSADILEALQKDKSGVTLGQKLKAINSFTSLMLNFHSYQSLTDRIEAYKKLFGDEKTATFFASSDLSQDLFQLMKESINLLIGIGCFVIKKEELLASLIAFGKKLESFSGKVGLLFQGVQIIKSIITLYKASAKGDWKAVEREITFLTVSVINTIASIEEMIMIGSGASAVAAVLNYYVFMFWFFKSKLPDMVHDMNMGISKLFISREMMEIETEFENCTREYLYLKYDTERTEAVLKTLGISFDSVDSWPAQLKKLVAHRTLQLTAALNNFRVRFEAEFKNLQGTDRKLYGTLYQPIFEDAQIIKGYKFLNDIGSFKNPNDMGAEHLDYISGLKDIYERLYELIVKCYLQTDAIAKQRVDLNNGNEINEITNANETFEYDNLLGFGEGVSTELLGETTNVLSASKLAKAASLNVQQIKKSGLAQSDIENRLSQTVSLETVRRLLASANQSTQPGFVFTEALHQFQIGNFINPNEHDGILGQSTLDTLGFLTHGLRTKLNSSSFYGQSQLNRSDVKSQVQVLTNNQFSSANWYQFIVRPSWLGIKISDGVHILLWQKLQEVQSWLLSQPQYKGMSTAQLGKALGLTASSHYSGARLSAAKQAMHGFGLAIDINVEGNPWIGAGWIQNDTVLLQERYRMIDALRKASGNNSLPGKTVFEYLHSIAQAQGNDTTDVYNTLKQRSDEFVAYLKLNPPELQYWKNSQTFGGRNPLNGFLNLHHDLVYALRQTIGLAWGAVDFGPRASGDIMHFDLRTLGPGKFLCQKISGYIPTSGHHPAIANATLSHETVYEESNDNEWSNESPFHEAIEEAEWENHDDEEANAQFEEETIPLATEFQNEILSFESTEKLNEGLENQIDFTGESMFSETTLTGESDFEEQTTETLFEGILPVSSLTAVLLHDDLKNPVTEGEIIGLDGGQNVNISLTTNITDGKDKKYITMKLVFRTPDSVKTIYEENVDVPKIGPDPADSSKLLFQKSKPLKSFGKLLTADGINEIATVRRNIDSSGKPGTSDGKLIAALGSGWQSRGRGIQSTNCGTSSLSFKDERPDALQLLKAGGVAIMELKDSSGALKTKRFVRNPADIFYYTGHGIALGYSNRVKINPPWNCLVINDEKTATPSPHGYCCWATPKDLIDNWKSPMDLDAFIIAGCAVLGVDGSKTPLTGDGVKWAELLHAKGGPLLFLLGYGDLDSNEVDNETKRVGPHGSTAPLDSGGGDDIAEEIGKWIKAQPKNLNGIIKKWLSLHMLHESPYAVGMDKDAVYWRIRRRPPSPTPKATPGWTLSDTQTITTLPGNTMTFITEFKKI